jgi:hypothetical protein
VDFVHGTAETVKSVVVEQLPVVVAKAVVACLLWAFAGTIDTIATATPATKSNAVFIAISSQILGRLDAIPERFAPGRSYRRLRPASIAKQATADFKSGH